MLVINTDSKSDSDDNDNDNNNNNNNNNNYEDGGSEHQHSFQKWIVAAALCGTDPGGGGHTPCLPSLCSSQPEQRFRLTSPSHRHPCLTGASFGVPPCLLVYSPSRRDPSPHLEVSEKTIIQRRKGGRGWEITPKIWIMQRSAELCVSTKFLGEVGHKKRIKKKKKETSSSGVM